MSEKIKPLGNEELEIIKEKALMGEPLFRYPSAAAVEA
jgi:hypothetical protein